MSYLKQYIEPTKKMFNHLGYRLDYLDSRLKKLDKYYDKHYQNRKELTREISDEWIYSIKTKSRHVISERVNTIKYLGIYLNSIGISAYIPDYSIRLGPHKVISLFDDDQLVRFFRGADNIKPHIRSPNREYIIPIIFRLIYTCGLRNSEACHIKMEDIDLKNGTISIYHSKGNKDRTVYMSESMKELCIRFNDAYSGIILNREYFFQPSYDKTRLTKHNIDDFFDKVLELTLLNREFSIKPTVHGLRHLFAVNSMRKCLDEGESFENWIKYLSQYMGHKSVNETMYYLHLVEMLVPEYREKMSAITEGIGVSYEED